MEHLLIAGGNIEYVRYQPHIILICCQRQIWACTLNGPTYLWHRMYCIFKIHIFTPFLQLGSPRQKQDIAVEDLFHAIIQKLCSYECNQIQSLLNNIKYVY